MRESVEPRCLVLTVGTGDQLRRDETLLIPLKKSIRKGEWSRIVLLPSQMTRASAEELKRELHPLAIDVCPLSAKGAENDVDACYGHFERVLSGLREDGFTESRIMVDFTRGTKAMSAAVVLASVRHNFRRLRYIFGERDERGMVVPGTEQVSEFGLAMVHGRRRLDDARQLMRCGQFAGALELLPDCAGPAADEWPEEVLRGAQAARPLAEFYAAWERLDYGAAASVDLSPRSRNRDWKAFEPDAGGRKWVQDLAAPLPTECRERANALRKHAIDLLANAERRIRQQYFEDALIRLYRVLELIGQIRLYDHGHDSANLRPEHPDVVRLLEKMEKEKAEPMQRNRKGILQAGRDNVARLLGVLGDPFGKRLRSLAQSGEVKPNDRNHSILIHGFERKAGSRAAPLQHLSDQLAALLIDDGGDVAQRSLSVARSMTRFEEA